MIKIDSKKTYFVSLECDGCNKKDEFETKENPADSVYIERGWGSLRMEVEGLDGEPIIEKTQIDACSGGCMLVACKLLIERSVKWD